MDKDIQIVTLADHPEYVEVCGAWTFAEWGCLLGFTLESSLDNYRQSLGTDMPCTFVALKGNKPVGTVSLKREDYILRKDLTPWLSGMYIHPFYRKEGIGTLLATHAEEVARKKFQVQKLHLITELAFNMYTRLGWQKIGEYPDKFARSGTKIHLMEKDLAKSPTEK